MSVFHKRFNFGQRVVTLETGAIACQATGSVVITMGDTVLLVTAVAMPSDVQKDFFPLTVVYQGRSYASGKIPGGFLKREGRPTEYETLVSRLIDRPMRPLFAADFTDEVQVIATLLSLDPEVEPDIPAMIGASAAVCLAGLPFKGPIGASRVGYINGEYLLNPTLKELENSALDLVVAGTDKAILMVESEAKELSEEVMLGAVMFGHQQMQGVIHAISELVAEAGKPGWKWQPVVQDANLINTIKVATADKLVEAFKIQDKKARQNQRHEIHTQTIATFCTNEPRSPTPAEIRKILHKQEEEIVRTAILTDKVRIDGRDCTTVRPIQIKTSFLPRTHGSACFTRGETQAIVVVTLGTEADAQVVTESVGTKLRESFMLHYNFPPYSVGEIGMVGTPKRREIGHGRLAKRGLQGVMPSLADFPYVIRLVSEIAASNGSSSMASICGGSLALMDAGVPIKSPVAGIAMGLIKEENQFVVLTDILGDEDHLGDMDFKVARTAQGITALQMDIKIQGITQEIMYQALQQAKEGLLHILAIMNQHISTHKTDLSVFAPRIAAFKINPDKIREVIGKGGVNIRGITEATGVNIELSDDGNVKIASIDQFAIKRAWQMIENIIAEVEVGAIYEGKVVKITDFGAFVAILPNKQGLVHVSQIAQERVERVQDRLTEGQIVRVKVIEIDRQGRIRLSMKEALDIN